MDMKTIFMGLQEEMVAKLSIIKQIDHPGTKGDATEINWLGWLKNYLPKRYSIDKALIIDCHGNVSDQIDIVIYDQQYTPFVFNQEGSLYIPAESVYAIFEVKQKLEKENIEYAGEKVKSVRNLIRTSTEIPHAGGNYKPKKPFKILGGILCCESGWVPPLGETLDKCLLNMEPLNQLDFGCALKDGSFKVEYENETIKEIQKSTKNEALIFLFLKLFMELQSRATVPAIDINEYACSLESF
jgi:hypothetical protein